MVPWRPPYGYSVQHALSLRHNEVRDLTATLLRDVAHDVEVEPHLQPVTGEHFLLRSTITAEQARLGVVVSGLHVQRFERTFLDAWVFNPFAPSNRKPTLAGSYRKHEEEKRRSYESRISQRGARFLHPVVFSTTGGQGKAASTLFGRIAGIKSEKNGEPFSVAMALIRFQLSFALVKAAVACLRGHRHKLSKYDPHAYSATLAVSECHLSVTYLNLSVFSGLPLSLCHFVCYIFLGFQFFSLHYNLRWFIPKSENKKSRIDFFQNCTAI